MSILVHTEKTHMSDVSRVARMVLGMLVIIGCAVAASMHNSIFSGTWFAFAMWPAAYLMFTGFIGFDPLNDPRRHQKKCEKPLPPVGPFIVHSY